MTLVVDGLTVRTNRHGAPLLHDVSFAVASGSVLGVAGSSGSGKSTLLATVAGLIRPSAGRIEVAGSSARRPSLLASLVGYVPASPAVEDELTPTEHLLFHASLRGVPRAQRAGLVAGLIELADLGDWSDVPGRRLTEGLRRRVAIARALIHDPAVVLLDDPVAGLDPSARADLADLLLGLADAGRTVVVAGGDLDDFDACLTHLAVLDAGRVTAFGPVDDVLRRADGSRQVRVRLRDGSEQFYDVGGPDEQRRLLAHLVADGAEIDEVGASTGISARLITIGRP